MREIIVIVVLLCCVVTLAQRNSRLNKDVEWYSLMLKREEQNDLRIHKIYQDAIKAGKKFSFTNPMYFQISYPDSKSTIFLPYGR